MKWKRGITGKVPKWRERPWRGDMTAAYGANEAHGVPTEIADLAHTKV